MRPGLPEHRLTIIAMVTTLLLFGCGQKPAKDTSQQPQQTIDTPPVSLSDDPTQLPLQNDTISAEAARRTAIKWQQARNQPSNKRENALLATRFEGIIHHQDQQATRSNRETWLSTPPAAILTRPSIQGPPTLFDARGVFVARWFFPNGPPRVQAEVLIAPEDNQPAIIRAELFDVPTPQAPPKPDFLDNFFLVIDDRYVVFGPAPKGTGPAGALYVNDQTAIKPIRTTSMPRRLRWTMKQTVILGYEDGSIEKTRIRGIRSVARFTPHESLPQHWHQQELSELERGEVLFALAKSANSTFTCGIVNPKKHGVLFAMVDNGNTPKIYRNSDLSRRLLKSAIKRISRRSDVRQIQNRFQQSGLSGSWLDYESTVFARQFEQKDKRRKFCTILVKAGTGCGDFYASILGIYNLKTGHPVDIGYPKNFFKDSFVDDHRLLLAIDIDRDGFPELIGHHKVLYRKNGRWRVYELRIPFQKNPC